MIIHLASCVGLLRDGRDRASEVERRVSVLVVSRIHSKENHQMKEKKKDA
jgi:hypothetical protein